MTAAPAAAARVEGDGHVHLYRDFDVAGVVEAALARSRASGGPELLLVVDPERERGFPALRGLGLPSAVATREGASLRFESEGGLCVAIAGRQFVSAEGLEVLGVGLDPDAPESGIADRRHSARDLVGRALAAGAAAVLPWGVGKWLGARGALVASLCEEPELRAEPRFLLGDVAQRARPWPQPKLFARGPRLLCGSDPLPVPGAERRIGRYGFRMECALDPDRPARSWLDALARGTPLEARGAPEGPLSTLREQWRHRRRSRAR